MYLQDFTCTFAFATLAAAAVTKQIPQPGWDKYAGERHGEHHEGQHHGHVHAREAEAEADPAQKAAWEHAHGGPAATYKWTLPTGTHGFPTGWATKVPRFQHGPHQARDAMPEPEAEAEAAHSAYWTPPAAWGAHKSKWSLPPVNPHHTHTAAPHHARDAMPEPEADAEAEAVHALPRPPPGGYHQSLDWSNLYAHPNHYLVQPHHARDAMPEAEAMAEPGFGHHTHGHHAQHTGASTEPAAWKSWLSAHPSLTHAPHHARDAEADPGFQGFPEFQHHEHGAQPVHATSWSHPAATGAWTEPAAWKSWFSSHPYPTEAPHHARDAEAEPGFKEGFENFGSQMKQGFENFGQEVKHGVNHFAGDVPDFGDKEVDTSLEGYGDLHARDAEAEPGVQGSFEHWGNMMKDAVHKADEKIEHHAQHFARDIPDFDGEEVDTSLEGYDDIHARDAEPEADAYNMGFVAHPTGSFPHGMIPKHGNHWARDVPDFGGEDVDTSLAGYESLRTRDVPDFGDEDIDTSLEDYSLHARDVEGGKESEEVNFLARREAEDEYDEPSEEVNYLARREAEDEGLEESEEVNFLARREAEADPRNAFQAGEGAHPALSSQAAGDDWVTSDWHKAFLTDHGVKPSVRDVGDAEAEADFNYDAGVYDDAPVAAEYTAPPSEEAEIQ